MVEQTQPPLASRLRRADSKLLLELVIEHARELTLREVRQILLNPYLTPEIISELAATKRLISTYEVRSGLARHHRTPKVTAQGLLPGLYWRDLAEISREIRVHPLVRRSADAYLIKRLPRLAVGERIAVARMAGRAVLAQLLQDPNPRVVQAMLDNPRLLAETLLPMVASEETLPRQLQLVAENERWSRRYDVRAALSLNPRTLFRTAFEILPTLRRDDLEAVAAAERLSSVVRRRARALLDQRSAPEAS